MTEYISGKRLFRVVGFDPSHRQLRLWSEALAVEGTSTRVEVWIGHVELMFLKPYYRDGLHVRPATAAEFAVLSERHGIPEDDAVWTWMLAPGDGSFVVGGNPAWREAEYDLMDGESLFDFGRPWPPPYPARWGMVE
ncbi:hypothetical protein [Streptomyces sp. NPDC048111]|uniref:hypothetical protein n=1 Tax=Streptomyces sp. NPDC048111 TaxID=3365500 RepID=UPI003720A233